MDKIKKLEKYSKSRLNEIQEKVKKIEELKDNNLCIYTTGSYGRLEASKNSDLDLFFIDSCIEEENQTPNIDKILINSSVIKICRDMNLPEFSKDGGYLTIHSIKDIINDLGGPSDDFKNYFTARMLLLLESKPIYNEKLHEKCLSQIIKRYYLDFHDHSKNFKPVFLVNDILRFWKTLCLNYEHRRNRKKADNKSVNHSKNLKLGFSRKLTCFSFILKLIASSDTVSEKDILVIALMTPIERLNSLKTNKVLTEKIDELIELYQWFLNHTQVPSKQMIEWISDKSKRDDAFDKSRLFGKQLFDIMQELDNQDIIQKILI